MEIKYQIKNADNKYVSIGMDGKPKWFESPDMGYTYTAAEAETFKVILEGLGFQNLSITPYDKDWWKEKMNLGGNSDGHSDSELAMGIEVEKEHVGTLEKLVKGEISLAQAPEYIAKDHLQEDPKYYTKLVAMESNFSGGEPTAEGMLKIISQDPTVITASRITAMPTELLDDMPKVFVTINGKEEYLFEYYPDEISFTPEEFIGKTIEEARHLKFEKDKMYLQGHSYAGGDKVQEFTSIDDLINGNIDRAIEFIHGVLKSDPFYTEEEGPLMDVAEQTIQVISMFAKHDENNPIITQYNDKVFFKAGTRLLDQNGGFIGTIKYAAHFVTKDTLDAKHRTYDSGKAKHIGLLYDCIHNPDTRAESKEGGKHKIFYLKNYILENKERRFATLFFVEIDDGFIRCITIMPNKTKNWGSNLKKNGGSISEPPLVSELSPNPSKDAQVREISSKAIEHAITKESDTNIQQYIDLARNNRKEGEIIVILDEDCDESFAGGGDFLLSTDLYNRIEGHNKEYHLQIVKSGDGYNVVAQYGAIGSHLREDDKGYFSSYAEAEKEFLKVKKSKLHKGYVEQGQPEPKPKAKFKVGDYVKLKNDASLLKVVDLISRGGVFEYALSPVTDESKSSWNPENKITFSELPFKIGDDFKTSSGDKYNIDGVFDDVMVYKSISGIETNIPISTAVRLFEEGFWKLEKDAPNEYYNLIGKKVKVVELKGKFRTAFFPIENVDNNRMIHIEDTGKSMEGVSVSASDYIGIGNGTLSLSQDELDDLADGKMVQRTEASYQIGEPERKLTRMEFYEKFGY